MRNSLFALLLVYSPLAAQISKSITGTVTHNEGYKLVNYQLPSGNIKIITTDDQGNFTEGLFTGTVLLEPAGKPKTEKNLKDLREHSVNIDGTAVNLNAAQQQFSYTHAAGKKGCSIQLNHRDGSSNPLEWMTAEPKPISALIPKRSLTCPQKLFFKDGYIPIFSNSERLRFARGDRFYVGDTKNKIKELTPVCSSPATAVFKLPDGIEPGPVTIYMYRDNAFTDGVVFYYYDLQFTSPNTNLRSGQLSTVTAKILTGTGDYPMPLPFSLDVKNLSSSVIAMQGGNFQHFEFPTGDETSNSAVWSVTRTITGIVPGSFDITATLYPDNVISESPFSPQLNVLQTPEEFNNWLDKLNEDLGALNDPAHYSPEVVKWIINNNHHCPSAEKLDEYKSFTGMLLRNIDVPKGAGVLWPSSLQAAKTACSHIKADYPVDMPVIRNGISYCDHLSKKPNIKNLNPDITDARLALQELSQNTSAENLTNCRNRLQRLFSSPELIRSNPVAMYTYRELLYASYQLLAPKVPGGVHPFDDLIGYVDIKENVFYIDAGSRDLALASLNAVAIANGKYRIKVNENDKEIDDTVTVSDKSPQDEFIDNDNEGVEIPGLDLPQPMQLIAHFAYGKGDVYKIYKNADCVTTGLPIKGGCIQEPNGFNWIIENKYTRSACAKGKGFCVEVDVIFKMIETFKDSKCKIKIGSTNYSERGCK